jgi:hypothetical protein
MPAFPCVNLGFLDQEPLLFYSSSSSDILTRLSGTRSRTTTSHKIEPGTSVSVARNSDHYPITNQASSLVTQSCDSKLFHITEKYIVVRSAEIILVHMRSSVSTGSFLCRSYRMFSAQAYRTFTSHVSYRQNRAQ